MIEISTWALESLGSALNTHRERRHGHRHVSVRPTARHFMDAAIEMRVVAQVEQQPHC